MEKDWGWGSGPQAFGASLNHWTTGQTCIQVPTGMLSTHPYWSVTRKWRFLRSKCVPFFPFLLSSDAQTKLGADLLGVLSVNTRVCVCVCGMECQSIKAGWAPCDNTGTDSGVWRKWKYSPFPSSCSKMDVSALCIKGSSSCKTREPWSLWLSLCEKCIKQSPTRSELFFLKDNVLFRLLFKRYSLLSSGSRRSKTSTTTGLSAEADTGDPTPEGAWQWNRSLHGGENQCSRGSRNSSGSLW